MKFSSRNSVSLAIASLSDKIVFLALANIFSLVIKTEWLKFVYLKEFCIFI
jgi:hypothetical protein